MPLLKDDHTKQEVINGIIYNMSPSGSISHAQINSNIHLSLRKQLKASLCIVGAENIDLFLTDTDYVTPDIMLICDRNQIKKEKYRGIPRFIVETISPSTAHKDRTVKMDVYAKLGVDEYWIVIPQAKTVEVYYLEGGNYILTETHMLVDDPESDDYNEDTMLTLKAMPTVKMTLADIFEGL